MLGAINPFSNNIDIYILLSVLHGENFLNHHDISSLMIIFSILTGASSVGVIVNVESYLTITLLQPLCLVLKRFMQSSFCYRKNPFIRPNFYGPAQGEALLAVYT